MCDSEYKVLYLNARHAGATHDAFVWQASQLREELLMRLTAGDRSSWLLGVSVPNVGSWLFLIALLFQETKLIHWSNFY